MVAVPRLIASTWTTACGTHRLALAEAQAGDGRGLGRRYTIQHDAFDLAVGMLEDARDASQEAGQERHQAGPVSLREPVPHLRVPDGGECAAELPRAQVLRRTDGVFESIGVGLGNQTLGRERPRFN